MLVELIPKKRILQPHLHKKHIAKQNVEHGKAHKTRSGKEISEKNFAPQTNCKCPRECPNKIDVDRQKEIFDTYYNELNWSQKTLYIRSSIITKKLRKRKICDKNPQRIKNFTFKYHLIDSNGISRCVCRDFFINCLQITTSRVSHAVKSSQINPNAIENRGRRSPGNKTKEEDKIEVRKFIDANSTEHQQKVTQKNEIKVIKLYREYKSLMESRHQNSVSERIFRDIFKEEEYRKSHKTKSGKDIVECVFKRQDSCKCARGCSRKIDVVRQKDIFNTYHNEFDYSRKTLFIRSAIVTKQLTKNNSDVSIGTQRKKNFTYKYHFNDVNGITQCVCRDFFLNCLQITTTRLSHAIKSSATNPNAIDNRGKKSATNKTKDEDRIAIIKFIESIPTYESHYNRKLSHKKYLKHDLNIIKLYREYKTSMEFNKQNVISERVFRDIFHKEFNLNFKHYDVCRTCETFKTNLQNRTVSNDLKKQFQSQKDNHLKLIEMTNENFRKDVEIATNSTNTISVLTFDLQKILETPSIPASVALHKRQLWTYNLCVYDEVDKKGK